MPFHMFCVCVRVLKLLCSSFDFLRGFSISTNRLSTRDPCSLRSIVFNKNKNKNGLRSCATVNPIFVEYIPEELHR